MWKQILAWYKFWKGVGAFVFLILNITSKKSTYFLAFIICVFNQSIKKNEAMKLNLFNGINNFTNVFDWTWRIFRKTLCMIWLNYILIVNLYLHEWQYECANTLVTLVTYFIASGVLLIVCIWHSIKRILKISAYSFFNL